MNGIILNFQCAEDEESRNIVFELKAIDPLMAIIQDTNLKANKVKFRYPKHSLTLKAAHIWFI